MAIPHRYLASIVLAVAPCAATAAPASGAKVQVGQPAGFDTLLQPQQAVADVYTGGRLIGQARVRFVSGSVTLLDVDALLALIPDLVDRAAVRAALAAPSLDSHAGLICPAEADPDKTGCGQLRPETAGVIFNERRFRIDLFVNAKLLAVHAVVTRAYLPRPEAGLSLVDQVSGTIAGTGGDAQYSLQNRAVLGWGAGRLRSDLSYTTGYGLLADTLAVEVDRPGLRYSAGAMWAPGIDLTGRRKIVGVALQSQTDTRLDRASIAGTPLVVSLAQRARVDILRDGRLLASRTYDAGNQTLDSSGLADGSYEVVLHIQEAGGATRDERRFFTKNAAIAAVGEPIFFAYGGVLGEDSPGSVISPTRTAFYEAGVARRFTSHVALDATLMGTNRTGLLELGGYWLTRATQLRVAALANVRGDAGVLLQAASSGTPRIAYNLDFRRVWNRSSEALIPVPGDSSITAAIGVDRTAQLSTGSFTQVSGTLSFQAKPGQIGVTGSLRSDRGSRLSYAIGPTVYWPLLERGGLQMTLRGDMTISNAGKSAFIGISFQRLQKRGSFNGTAGVRATSGSGATPVGAIGGSMQRDGVLGGDLTLGGSLEREVDGSVARARGDLHTQQASVYADIAQPIAGDNGQTQYSLSFQTTAAVGGSSVQFRGRDQSESVIVVEVEGAKSRAPFEVLVDNTPRGIVHVGDKLSIAVPAYKRYAVRLRSIGEEIMRFDGATKQVSLYPGNVTRVVWRAHAVMAMFGRVISTSGSPVANAAIHAADATGQTDANGYFQIEASPDAVLKVQGADGRSCDVPLAAKATAQGFAALGNLTCIQPLPRLQMADISSLGEGKR